MATMKVGGGGCLSPSTSSASSSSSGFESAGSAGFCDGLGAGALSQGGAAHDDGVYSGEEMAEGATPTSAPRKNDADIDGDNANHASNNNNNIIGGTNNNNINNNTHHHHHNNNGGNGGGGGNDIVNGGNHFNNNNNNVNNNKTSSSSSSSPTAAASGLEDQRALQIALELSMLGLGPNAGGGGGGGGGEVNVWGEPNGMFLEQNQSPVGSLGSFGGSLDDDDGPNKKGQNMTECVPVPSSEHVAEIVGRQGRSLYVGRGMGKGEGEGGEGRRGEEGRMWGKRWGKI